MTTPAILDCPDTANVRLLFFGKLADRFGRLRSIAIPSAGCTIADLRRRLVAETEGGDILAEPSVRAAVDQNLAVDDAAPVRGGQEVAFLPAFSGG
ncbi:MAG: MoaD/ThiS family protein [Phenylobacterium sp.]|uniref:MoaD/ThiS family protein n=1 Tax=Phenylobacterium sp. TaxID=1871053 RepID=UPI001A61A30F|nr:MoaD/ThiS family protein [Phenylobacterium sp.]MBL8556195.1 MoaD/ThiS family protein [Phenylobacterium sp.]